MKAEKALTCFMAGSGDDVFIFRKGDGQDRLFDVHGSDTLELHGFTADDLAAITMKYVDVSIQFSLNDDENFLYLDFWVIDRWRIETLKIVDESGSATSYDLSGHTFEKNTDVRIAELIETTPQWWC